MLDISTERIAKTSCTKNHLKSPLINAGKNAKNKVVHEKPTLEYFAWCVLGLINLTFILSKSFH